MDSVGLLLSMLILINQGSDDFYPLMAPYSYLLLPWNIHFPHISADGNATQTGQTQMHVH